MKYLIYLLTIIILLGLNIGLFGNFPIAGQVPNLLMLLTLYFAVDKNNYDFFFIAFVSGLFLDSFSANYFGAWTAAFLLLALALHFLSNQLLVLEINWKTLSLLVLCSWGLVNLCVWLYGWLAYKGSLTPDYAGLQVFLRGFLPGLFYNWLLLYPMYVLVDNLKSAVANFTVRSRGVVK